MTYYIGLLSGTSMDGIDAALVDVSTHTLIQGITRPYSEQAMHRLRAVLSGEHRGFVDITQLHTILGREFARVVLDLLDITGLPSKRITAIGSHGQTIAHDATADIPYTLQLGCAHTLAESTGITVVADFRTRDLVAGGQGAPFAPAYHQALFSKHPLPMAVVNIGGIANVTFLNHDGSVSGFDTGPGNGLMDAYALEHLHQPFDRDGAWAASGQVIESLLLDVLSDAYFCKPAPKSLDKAYFSKEWLSKYLPPDYNAADVQATLAALTAITITNAVQAYDGAISCLAVCGGGVHNAALMARMRYQLPQVSVISTAELGVDPDYLEAMMFAWFADKALTRTPLNLMSITGARYPAILGAVYWAR
jgi:anhydro-N-acetylmuramic acid kinase